MLSNIEIYRGFKRIKHNLDDIDLSDNDQDILKQNNFEREW